MLASLALALTATVLSVPEDPVVPEAITALREDSSEEAIAAVLALPVEESVPALVGVVEDGGSNWAWQAGRVLRRIAERDANDRVWREQARALGAVLLSAEREPLNRFIAGTSLVGLEKSCKPLFEDFAEILAADQPPLVHMGATLALGGWDAKAIKELKPNLASESCRARVWSSAAIRLAGNDAKSLKKSLTSSLEEEDSIAAYLTATAVREALIACASEKEAEKAWEKRAKPAGMIMYGKVNYAGLAVHDPNQSLGMLVQGLGVDPDLTRWVRLPDDQRMSRMGDVVRLMSLEMATRTVTLAPRLAADEFRTHEQWEEASREALALARLYYALGDGLPL